MIIIISMHAILIIKKRMHAILSVSIPICQAVECVIWTYDVSWGMGSIYAPTLALWNTPIWIFEHYCSYSIESYCSMIHVHSKVWNYIFSQIYTYTPSPLLSQYIGESVIPMFPKDMHFCLFFTFLVMPATLSMIWYDMIYYDMIYYDMIYYDMIYYDIKELGLGVEPGIFLSMIWYDILIQFNYILWTPLSCEHLFLVSFK